jgi:hypothetical protein
MNKITKGIFGIFIICAGLFGATASANAACSYNGYYNSNGQCTSSYISSQRYSYTNSSQTTSIVNLEAQIQQLIAMLEQLKFLQAQQGNYDPISNGNSDVDVVTRSPQNVEDEEATLRGEVDFNNEDGATVYFQYGKTSSNLKYETVQKVLDEDDDDEEFLQKLVNLSDDTKYYYRAVAEDERGRADYGSILNFTTDDDNRNGNRSGDDEPDVDVDDADEIDVNSAELSGDVDMNDFNNGIVFFVYGEDEDQVEDVEKDYDEYTDVDTDDDDLQKRRVDTDLDNKDDYTVNIGGLNDDTDIYFAICVEYEDEDDDQVLMCSSVEEFTTDYDGGSSNSSGDDEPEVETEGSSSITDDSAKIRGEVSMNDFNNGIVFFVYGEDEDQIEDIEDDYDEYTDVDEDGDDLQKIKVDSDLDDNNAEYTASFNGLNDDTDIFYTICVEYEDEDDDQVLMCGGVEDFTTDND